MARRLFEQRNALANPPQWLVDYINGGESSYSGESVTVTGSLKVTAVMAGFTILCEDTASLPLVVYERKERSKDRAVNHPYYFLMHDEPNPEMTSMVFRELIVGHLLGWGNFYAQKLWDRRGIVRELWALNPSRMEVFRDASGEKRYLYTELNGNKRAFTSEEILHVPAFGFDGLVGYSRIALARNAIGLSMSAEKYGSKVFANDARPSVVLKSKKKLTPEAQKSLRESWNQLYGGSGNGSKTAVLEEDLDLQTIGFPPEDTQFLQTRQFQVSEIARIFRIPPHMIGDVEKSTSWGSGIEQQELGYYRHTLRPWLVRIEQQLNKDLFLKNERSKYFFEHIADANLRADTQARYTAYASAITNGWMTRNEVRELENKNPIDGLDEILVPLNMGGNDQNKDDQSQVQVKSRGFVDVEPLLRDAFARIARRDQKELDDARKRWLEKGKNERFEAFLEQFYKRDLPNFAVSVMEPMVRSGLVDAKKVAHFAEFYGQKRGLEALETSPDAENLFGEWSEFEELYDE